jgi:hypothetical protein
MKHDLSQKRVIAPENLIRVCQGIYGREETTVEPPTTLENEIGHVFGYVGFASGAFDVLQNPSAIPLRYQLEA